MHGVCVCGRARLHVCHSFSLMQRSEVHGHASETDRTGASSENDLSFRISIHGEEFRRVELR